MSPRSVPNPSGRAARACLLAIAGVVAAAASTSSLTAQRPSAPPARARATSPAAAVRPIRRDIPITNMMRGALAAGTRDSSGRPGPKYWQLWMDYSIDARLDPGTATVSGKERAVLRNASDSTLRWIQIRLDQNIFRPDAARLAAPPEVTEGMQVSRIAVNGQPLDLAAPAPLPPGVPERYRGPPLATQLHQTSVRLPLATPLAPGGTATLEIDWSFHVPRVDAGRGIRMGRWADSLFQVAQWYPRVAVYDDLKGWDVDPYLGAAEFYNNFGHFDVRIDVPAGWLVGATGVLQNPDEVLPAAAKERLSHVLESDSVRRIVTAAELPAGAAGAAGQRRVWHFVADSVGDVAWAASRGYVWDATRATIPGRGPVPINLLYLPGDARNFAEAPRIARHALEFYSRLWMPYAFPQLTLVDGPELGMEYPQIIFSAAGAADHEAGHEWWPMMVGVNETWWGFMDEGFNQYMNILSDADAHGQPAKLDGLGQAYGQISGSEQEPPLIWDANYAGPMYGFQAYGKAPLMLSMLGGVVGDSAVQRAMSEYAHAWRFKHPSPWDYAFFMSNALRRDLGWFWYSWLFSTDAVNGSIQSVTAAGPRTTVVVRQDGQMPSPVVLKVQFAATGPAIRPMPGSSMVDATTALVTYPVDVWFGGDRTFTARLDFGGRRIERIVLDPHCRFPDRDASDNVWPRKPATPTAAGNPMMLAMRGPQCEP